VERQADLDALLDRPPVRHGQRSRQRQADRAGLAVRRAAEAVLAAAEHLRPRLQLDVDLQPDDRLPAAHSPPSETVSGTCPRNSFRLFALMPDTSPARDRSRAPPRARGRRGRACSPRTAGRRAGAPPAAPPTARTAR